MTGDIIEQLAEAIRPFLDPDDGTTNLSDWEYEDLLKRALHQLVTNEVNK